MVHRSDESLAYEANVTDLWGSTLSTGISLIYGGDVVAMEVGSL